MARHPRVLITGADGQVGRALRPLIPDGRFASRADVDVTRADTVRVAVEGIDVVIHLAANTYVDQCEVDPEAAKRVNAQGTLNVVDAARAVGARVMYLSTDSVFSGDTDQEYTEDDPPAPINAYGLSKLEGERCLDAAAGDLIVRSSWIFGDGRNFIRTIMRLSHEGPVSVVDDQHGRPTSASGLAQALVHVMGQQLTGILHVAGDGSPCTWAELARTALRAARIDQEVIAIDTPTYRANAGRVIALRPPNGALGLDKARSLGVPLLDWRASVIDYVETSI